MNKDLPAALVQPLKAKVVAEYFTSCPTIERLREIAVAFHLEAGALLRARKAEGPLLAVFREQDLKWRAFARRCPDVLPEAFQAVTHELIPETKIIWPMKS